MKKGLILALGSCLAFASLATAQSYSASSLLASPAAGIGFAPPPNGVADPVPPASVWFYGDYLLWWVSQSPLPGPLVSVGGLPGDPGSSVVYGGSPQGLGTFSGMRVGLGGWLDASQTWGMEASGFFLGQKDATFAISSDGGGNPLITQPILLPNGGTQGYLTSFPGELEGSLRATLNLRLYGWEINGMGNLFRIPGCQMDALLGFRALRLSETLHLQSKVRLLQDNALTFLGAGLASNSLVLTEDTFGASTEVYAPQLGTRFSYIADRFSADLTAKVALGVGCQTVDISGSTIYQPPFPATQTQSATGGIYAQSTNIGHSTSTRFLVVPEVIGKVRYEVLPGMHLSLGYGFLYLNDVVRPGNQIDRVVNPRNVPTDAEYGTYPSTAPRPESKFQHSSFWAHGLSVGAEWRY